MQFLWKYIDDLAGKGLPLTVLAEFLIYATAATMVPLALPLAMLLASMMTIGNFSEQYELTACKSSGISLWRMLRSLTVLAIITSVAALAFANYVVPVAYLKFGALYFDISHQRPALNIKPGVFYHEIDGFSIRIGSKEADNQAISNVMIYDHTGGKGSESVILANRGKMYTTADERYLVIELYEGHQYRDLVSTTRATKKNEFVRLSFGTWKRVFDLSDFQLSRTDESLFKESYQMQNLKQLAASVDTLRHELTKDIEQAKVFGRPYYAFLRTPLDSLLQTMPPSASDGAALAAPVDSLAVLVKALTTARNMKGYLDYLSRSQEGKVELLRRYQNERQRKFTLSFACFVLFLIGASLGAIIRKGGFGLPFVVSVFLFIGYYILSISGEKMAREGVLTPVQGMWFSTAVVFPMAILLVYQANRDAALMQAESYLRLMRRLVQWVPWLANGSVGRSS